MPTPVPSPLPSALPDTGYLRLAQIVNRPTVKASKGKRTRLPRSATAGVIPISASAWWRGVKDGDYPQPVKLGANTTAWRVEDIRALIESMGAAS